jgi:phosphoribosylformylglycinamidine synthase subunit PurQ / glutaminase
MSAATTTRAGTLRWGVLVFPGTNCELETCHVVRDVLGHEARMVWHQETDLSGLDAVIVPGGFAHGDYLRAGAVARFSPVLDAVREFAEGGGPVLGICNGFQVLLEAGLLPGAMLRNRSQRFSSRWVHLRVENPGSPFLRGLKRGEVLRMPMAHGEGNYYVDPAELPGMEARGQILLRYCSPTGELGDAYNPNGSVDHIAGIANERGNVAALMPHPERAAEAVLGCDDGLRIFEGMAAAFGRGPRA